MKLAAKCRKTGENVKILSIEFDDKGYIQSVIARLDTKIRKKFKYEEIKIFDQNRNEIKLYSESCSEVFHKEKRRKIAKLL